MSIKDFYDKIVASPDLEKALEEAIDSGKLDDFIKSNGCDGSADELSSYIAEHS